MLVVLQACHVSDVHATMPMQQCRWGLCAAELIIQSYLPLLVSQTPSLGSDASTPPALLTQLSYPWPLHACRANNNYFLYIYFIFCSMYLVLFSIVLHRTIVTVYTDNTFLYNYLWQMPQIIHLSPVECFTPALGKTMHKNREVSGVKVNRFWGLFSRKVATVAWSITTHPLHQLLGSIHVLSHYIHLYNVQYQDNVNYSIKWYLNI